MAPMPAWPDGPVHWLENVDSDPQQVRTACGEFAWKVEGAKLLDPNREAIYPVTCPKCIEQLKVYRGQARRAT